MASPLHLPLLLLPFFSALAITNSKTFPGDIESLKSIKQSIDPASIAPGSCLASWDFAYDPCDSSFTDHFTCGLRCDAQSSDGLSRVTDLSLDAAGYSGPLSPSVWSLPFLQSIDLADNFFSGDFPSPPPSSPPLQRLTLSRNAFSGEIPNLSQASPLQEAFLDGNFFSGPINSQNLVQLRLLQRLELQSNNLTGEIPDLSSLPSLSYFDASDNALIGGLPSNLPSSLLEISLRSNRLNGQLAGTAIANLSNLQVMDLSRNGFWGRVPKELFEHPALEQLTLSYNQFQWIEEPSDRGRDSGLVALDLGHNGLTGLLPGFVGSMPRLSAVDFQDNKFTGMIPAQYAMRAVGADVELVPFERLLLSGNYLFGPIPGPMGAMKEGSAVVSLADNCLFRCPAVFFFCQDGQQKPAATCREFNPVIP